MDPLSVAASITGLLLAGAKITVLLRTLVDAPSVVQTVVVEINHFVAVLAQLQQFMRGSLSADHSRASMIQVQQIQLILTGCVLTFSELQSGIDRLGDRSTFRARVRWVLAESSIQELVQRLRDHKSSLTLILTVLTCQSTSEAVTSMLELRHLLEHFIQRNSELYARVRELENVPQIQRRLSTTRGSIRSWTSSRIAFESALSNSRIYRRALRITSSDSHSAGLSVFSGPSLSDISNISVFRLAICATEISNFECYTSPLSSLARRQIPTMASTIPPIQRKEMGLRYVTDWRTRMNTQNKLLRSACIDGDHQLAKQLIENGASIEAFDNRSFTPLHLAARHGNHEAVIVLVGLGAKIDSQNWSGDTSLHLAARYGHAGIVEALVRLGADLEATNHDKRTPLTVATIARYDQTVDVLLKLGANAEHRGSAGDTAIHYAGQREHRPVVQAGGDGGANLRAMNDEVETAFGSIVLVPQNRILDSTAP